MVLALRIRGVALELIFRTISIIYSIQDGNISLHSKANKRLYDRATVKQNYHSIYLYRNYNFYVIRCN